MENTYLVHYGVKGMRWGVRRYQNEDGSYTRKGLAIYKDRYEKLKNAKSAYKNSKESGDKYETAKAKAAYKQAKKEESMAYKQLARDKKADQGKILSAQGQTITGNNIRNTARHAALAVGAYGAYNLSLHMVQAGKPKAAAALYALSVGSAAAGIAGTIKTQKDNAKIRAYYNHTRTVK